MPKIMSEEKIAITPDIVDESKKSAALVSDENLRKKVFVSFLALNSFVKFMGENDISMDIRESLSRVNSIFECIDLCHLTYKNLQIDIRVILEGNSFFIPKSHFRKDIVPDLYVVDKKLKDIEFLGYVSTNMLEVAEDLNEYYGVPIFALKPIEDLFFDIITMVPNKKLFDQSEHAAAQELFSDYFDGKLSKVEKMYLIKHLFYCSECREKFINFYDFDILAKQIQNHPQILKNSKLNIDMESDDTQEIVEELLSAPNKKNSDDEFFEDLRNDIHSSAPPVFKNKFQKALDGDMPTEPNQVSGKIPFVQTEITENDKLYVHAPVENDNNLAVLFDENSIPQEKTVSKLYSAQSSGNPKTGKNIAILVVALSLALALFSFGCYKVFKGYHKPQTASSENFDFSPENMANNAELNADAGPKDINKTIADSFNDYVSPISITKISWEVLPQYAESEVFVDYLQNTGASIQNNLIQDLAKIKEAATFSDVVVVSFTFTNNQSIKNFKIEKSSGSDVLDKAISNSVQNTLKMYSYPTFDSKVKSIDFKLIIGF